jgi:hypothetical protein
VAIHTNGSPSLELSVDVFPHSFWLSTERVSDKVDALLVIVAWTIVAIAMSICAILRNTVGYPKSASIHISKIGLLTN